MKIIKSKNKLQKVINNEKKIGFVPTMGGIHLGHLSLVKRSIKECNKTIVSIFVNKSQFNKINDFNKYPRNLKKDIKWLKKLKIDILYLPSEKDIYPKGPKKNIKLHSFAKTLCGKYRPGHFKAVVDVVERFIKIIKPSRIYFGEKDIQQLKLVENYIYPIYKDINVVECKTIREKNGIAYSSRNLLLNKKQIKIASKVYKIIKINKKKILVSSKFLKIVKNKILSIGVKKIEYLKVVNINKVIKPFKKKERNKILLSYYLEQIRLIDNI
tara:strand:- start:701 stop:1510 length:810 start_codon:yes stop_codon:yes gene_type:complete